MILLLLATMLLASSVSTGCRTSVQTDRTALEIIASEIPDLPKIPEWPDVCWSYCEGMYCLIEEDVDRVLDYLENSIPLYRFEMENYERELRIVLDGMLSI